MHDVRYELLTSIYYIQKDGTILEVHVLARSSVRNSATMIVRRKAEKKVKFMMCSIFYLNKKYPLILSTHSVSTMKMQIEFKLSTGTYTS